VDQLDRRWRNARVHTLHDPGPLEVPCTWELLSEMKLYRRDTPGYEQTDSIQRLCDESCGPPGTPAILISFMIIEAVFSAGVSILAKLGLQKLNLSLHLRDLLVEQSILSRIVLQRVSCAEPFDGHYHAPKRFDQRVGDLGMPFRRSVGFTRHNPSLIQSLIELS
jgi:hypothetical protein